MSVESLITAIATPPSIIVGLFLFVLNYLLNDSASRLQIGRALNNWTVWDGYTSLLSKALKIVDVFFGSKNCFSISAWVRCFQLAVIYPLFLLVIGWLLGGPTTFAGTSLFPEDLNIWKKSILTIFFISWSSLYGYYSHKFIWKKGYLNSWIERFFSTKPKVLLSRLSLTVIVLLIAGILACFCVELSASGVPLAVAYSFAMTFAFAGAVASPKASFFAFSCALATAAAVITKFLTISVPPDVSRIAIIISFAIVASLAVLLPKARAIPNALSSAIIFTILVAFASLGSISIASAAVIIFPTFPSHSGLIGAWVLFFFVFPVLNSVFDFFSWGVSRHLLRSITDKNTSIFNITSHVIADFIFAFTILFGLVITFVFAIEVFNHFLVIDGVASQFNWKIYATAALENPWSNGLLVSLIIFSTLIPTYFHFFLATLSLVIRIAPFRTKVSNLLITDEISNINKTIVSSWIVGYSIFAILCFYGLTKLTCYIVTNFGVNFAKSLENAAYFSEKIFLHLIQ